MSLPKAELFNPRAKRRVRSADIRQPMDRGEHTLLIEVVPCELIVQYTVQGNIILYSEEGVMGWN
jgi:hypothetical protein